MNEPTTPSTLRVALAGNPNAGKTSLFNALTGSHQHVGNYPGVTVEKRLGEYLHDGRRYEVVDLPGTYSLSAFSVEERITEEELVRGRPDVTIVVADSTNLGRHLVLLTQVMMIGGRIVLCLNMADEARDAGQRLDVEQMRRLLGFPVIETVGHRGQGVDELRHAVAASLAREPTRPRLALGDRGRQAVEEIARALDASGHEERGRLWRATRLLIGQGEPPADDEAEASRVAARWRAIIASETGLDAAMFLAGEEHGHVAGLLKEVTLALPRADAHQLSDRIDAVLCNRVLGLPFFFVVMYALFWLTFAAGEWPMRGVEWLVGQAARGVSALWPATHLVVLRSLVIDGVIGGVGGVIVFLPNIALLFFGLALLEDTGYMARAAFLTDRLMHGFGLHGKSFIPLVTGLGCSIPGIMATRILDNQRDRLITMLVLPLVSCGARLPIWLLLVPAFFPPALHAPALYGIYLFGILLALALALILRRTIFKGEEAPFVMELPPYRRPTPRGLLTKAGERSWLYLRKAGTVILAISVLMWFLSTYPTPDAPPAAIATAQEPARPGLERSFAGRIGQALEPVIAPLGFDWRIGTALVGAFAAKEVFVAQLGILYSLETADDERSQDRLRAAIRRDYTPASGLALMVFLLVATPCMATVAVVRRESGSWKWPLLQFTGLTALAWLLAFTVYRLAGMVLG